MFKKLFNLLFGPTRERAKFQQSYHEALLARIEQQERATKKIMEDNEKISRELDEQIEQLDSLLLGPEELKPKKKTRKKKDNS